MEKILFSLADVTMPKVKHNLEKDDFELLLGEICLNRVAGIAYKNIVGNPDIIAPKEMIKVLKILYEDNLKKSERYRKHIKYLSGILNNADFKYALLKGALLNTRVYESGLRTSNDIDILIEENDVSRCQKILCENGFTQGYFVPGSGIIPATRKEIILAKMNYGETIPFVKIIDDEPLVIDLNFSIDYKPEKDTLIVNRLLNNIEDVTYEDVTFKSLNLEDFIIHLCCHLYKEATIYDWVKRRKDLLLYKFSDLNVIFNCYLRELTSGPHVSTSVVRRKADYRNE